MDYQPAQIIKTIKVNSYKTLIVQLSDGSEHLTDFSSFENVHCFPKNFQDWKEVSIDSDGLSLVWQSGFETHVDQIISHF